MESDTSALGPPDFFNDFTPPPYSNVTTTEFITPHKIVVSIIMMSYVTQKKDDKAEALFMLDFGNLMWDLVEPSEPEIEPPTFLYICTRLIALRSQDPPNKEVDYLNEELYKILNDSLGLTTFMCNTLSQFVTGENVGGEKPIIREESPFGSHFLRRIIAEYEQICLDDWTRANRILDMLRFYVDGTNEDECLAEDDAERFIDHQTELLAGPGPYMTPKKLQQKLQLVAKRFPNLAKVHFLTYLNCVRAKDMEGAQEALTRYLTADGQYEQPEIARSKCQELALLNTAYMHMHLGRNELALQTLKSAMIVARDKENQPCLNRIQSCYNQLMRQQPADGLPQHRPLDQRSLDAFRAATKRDKQFDLTAYSELDRAKLIMQKGDDPAQVFASIQRAVAYIATNSLDIGLGTPRVVNAIVWKAYGNPTLSNLYANLLVNAEHKGTSAHDMASALSTLPFDSAKEGDYAKAIEMLNAGKERYPAFTSSEANIWMATALSILFERASGRHELSNAQQYASLFAALAEEVSEWRIVSEYQYASLARLEGRLEEAQGRFNKLIEDAKRKGSDTYQQAVPYYLQLAELHLDADDPYNAFPLVMTCILSASKYHMHLLVHHAKVVLAETLLHLNDNKKAADILKGVMPTILAHGDLQLRSMTLSVYAECLLTSAIGDVGLWPSVAPRVVRMLETAIQGFQKLGNLDGEFKAETLLALYYWAASEPERCQKHAATCRGLHVRKQQRRRAPPIQNVRQKLVEKEGVLHDLLANGEE